MFVMYVCIKQMRTQFDKVRVMQVICLKLSVVIFGVRIKFPLFAVHSIFLLLLMT